MATKFTKGGLLNTTQLQNLSGKKWKKGGILNAKQLNELAGSGGSNKICVINERTVELEAGTIQIDSTDITSGIFTAKLNNVEFPACGEEWDEDGSHGVEIDILANDKINETREAPHGPIDILKIYWDSNSSDNTAWVEMGAAYEYWATMYGGLDPSSLGPDVDPSTLVLPVPTVSVFVEPNRKNEFLVIELAKEDNEWKLKEDISKVFTDLLTTAAIYNYRSVFKFKRGDKTLYAYAGECQNYETVIENIDGQRLINGYNYYWNSSVYFYDKHIIIHLVISWPPHGSGEITYTLSIEEIANTRDNDNTSDNDNDNSDAPPVITK